eukprot:9112434-Alexandrium_andersonii.AAC.1
MLAAYCINLPVLQKITSGPYLKFITGLVKHKPRDLEKLQAVAKTINSNSVASRAQRAAAIMQCVTHFTRRGAGLRSPERAFAMAAERRRAE